MTPAAMAEVIMCLKPHQRDYINRMGFKDFLNMKTKKIPLKLAHFVLTKYDENDNIIAIGDKKISITKEKINKNFGLPIGGKVLCDIEPVSEQHPVFQKWENQFLDGKKNATNFKNSIMESSEADDISD
ncbi:hypothetical protein L1887_28046 [Cichorium endivia]|nr:hypothetical protein L1887_28046 [Cichorium endivia]